MNSLLMSNLDRVTIALALMIVTGLVIVAVTAWIAYQEDKRRKP